MFSQFRCRWKYSGLDGNRQFFSVSRSSARQTFAAAVVSAPSARESTNQITQTPLLLMDSTSVSKRSVRTWTVAVKLSRLSSRICRVLHTLSMPNGASWEGKKVANSATGSRGRCCCPIHERFAYVPTQVGDVCGKGRIFIATHGLVR